MHTQEMTHTTCFNYLIAWRTPLARIHASYVKGPEQRNSPHASKQLYEIFLSTYFSFHTYSHQSSVADFMESNLFPTSVHVLSIAVLS